MNSERLHIAHRPGAMLALLLLAAALIGGCNVIQPDETPWQTASAYSWPVGPGARALTFYWVPDGDTAKAEDRVFGMNDSTTSEKTFEGRPMYKLKGKGQLKYYFLPMRDTLVINSQVPFTLALTTPLQKGHSWICGYDANTGAPSWRGTIVGRYSYRNVKGRVYHNVIEVDYEQLQPRDTSFESGISWVQFFAEGIGPVQTIKLFKVISSNPSVSDKVEPIEEWTLLTNEELSESLD